MEKKCKKCNVVKDVCEFKQTKANKDGLDTICRECGKEKIKQFKKANKYYLKHLRQTNKEKLIEERKQFKEKNKHLRQINKEKLIEDIEKKKKSERNAKRKGLASFLTTSNKMKKQFTISFYTGGVNVKDWDILSETDKTKALKKAWCITWSFRNPETNLLERQPNIKGGVNRLKKKSQRLELLQNFKLAIIEAIEDGYSPYDNYPKENPIQYTENKRKKKREYTRKWREKNKEKIKKQVRLYQESNKDKIREDKKKYKEDNKEKTNKNAKYRWETDSLYRLKINTRRSVRNYLKGRKSKRTTEIVGMNFKEFQNYLEVEYTEGMHLDHIIPLSWANNDEEVYILNHYSNFQIITAEENIDKKDFYCKSENLKKVLDNHNDLIKLNKIIERNSDKIK